MRAAVKFFVFVMCFSLLSLQLSGLHRHVDTDHAGTDFHGTHLHQTNADSHDHDADVDLSISELGITWSKIILLFAILAVVLLVLVASPVRAWASLYTYLPVRHRSQWRPPLRAPPYYPL